METLIEIIKELRAENAELKVEVEEQIKSVDYWYEKFKGSITPKTTENGSN